MMPVPKGGRSINTLPRCTAITVPSIRSPKVGGFFVALKSFAIGDSSLGELLSSVTPFLSLVSSRGVSSALSSEVMVVFIYKWEVSLPAHAMPAHAGGGPVAQRGLLPVGY